MSENAQSPSKSRTSYQGWKVPGIGMIGGAISSGTPTVGQGIISALGIGASYTDENEVVGGGEIAIVKQSRAYSLVITHNNNYVTVKELGRLKPVTKDDQIITTFSNNYTMAQLLKEISDQKDARVLEAALRTPWLRNYEPFHSLTKLLLHMITLGNNTSALEYVFNSHSDEIDWKYTDQDDYSLFHLVLANAKLENLTKKLFDEKTNKLKPFINKITKSNQTLLSMACRRQLQPVIEVLVDAGASILIQDHEIWKLPEFTNISIHLGVVVVNGNNVAIIYVELTRGMAIYSLIANPEKVYMLEMKNLTPFNKLSSDIKKMILPQILKLSSPDLITLALGNQPRNEFDNSVLLMAVEHAHPVVLRQLLKIPRLSQTQQENTTRNNILHKVIQVNNLDNLEILMKEGTTFTINKNIDALNNENQTPIDLAIENQNYGAIKKIFNQRDLMDKLWLNQVDKAISSDNIDLLNVLMNYFIEEYKGKFMYEKTNSQGLSIVHIAVKEFKGGEAFNIILNKCKSLSAIRKQNLIECKTVSQLPDFKGQTPLIMSLIKKQYLATKKLLEAGATNLNEGDHCYFHYLIKFCEQKEELKKLLNIDLDPKQFSQCTKPPKVKIWEVTDNDSNTLLHYSVKYRNSIAIDLLGNITPFTDLLKLDSQGNSLLHTAATLPQHPTVIDSLFEILKKYQRHAQYSELLNLQNKNNGCTALMLAVQSNHFKFVESLVKEGASILPINHERDSILHIAAKLGREDIFKLILNIVDGCKRDRTDNLKMLHQTNSEGYSPIQCAVFYAKIAIIKLYGEKHSLSSCDSETGHSLLHLAVLIESINFSVLRQLIEELLTDRSLLEIRDKDGRTPLMLATINHKVDIISILLPYHPDLLAIDSQGLSLLHNAVISYNKPVFNMILNAINSGGNSKQILNFEDKKQRKTVLHYSIERDNKETVEEMLKLGISLVAKDIEGNTYLHTASKSPNTVGILKLILKYAKKRSTNSISELLKEQNNNILTPFLYAIYNQNCEACETLINEKANLFYTTDNRPAFLQTIHSSTKLIVCGSQLCYFIGYCFPIKNNKDKCWILSPLTNLETVSLIVNTNISVCKELNYDLVEKIVSCEFIQPLQTLLQQIGFSKCSPILKKSSLFIPAAQFGSLPVIHFLIKNYFSPQELMDPNHGNILYEAIHNPNIEIIKVLCDTVVEKQHFARIDKILSRKQGCDFCALELCVKLSRLETFQYLLWPEFWLSLELKNPEGTTLFHYILENVRVSETRKQFLATLVTIIQDRENKKPKSTYINNTPFVDCHVKNSGETPLHLCASKYPDCISTILQLNPSPIKEDSSGNTALHLSVKSANFNCTKEIINAYKNSGIAEIINKTNKKKQTPLHIAVEIANLEIVELLLRNNSKLYAVDDESKTVLHYAAQLKSILKSGEIAQFLLKHEIENPEPNQTLSNYQDTKGYTPLHSAIACSNLKSMNVLLQYNFEFNISDRDGNSILHLALLLCKSTMMVKSILESYYKDTVGMIHASNEDECINLKNNQGKTALILAIETENVDALNEILKYFPLLHLTDNDGNSCLHKAVGSANDLKCLDKLLEIIKESCPKEMKSYLSAINDSGLSPLYQAIMNQNHRAAEKLCEYGANIAIQLPNGKLTLCNGRELKFSIGVGPPPSAWRTIKDIAWSDAKDYFVCYEIVDKGTTHHIASLLPDLESTTISTAHLNIISSVTERALEVICSCHCIEPLINAIDKGWIDFSKEDTDMQWKVLCGDVSKEATDYLYTRYPVEMKSSKMFKRLENTTKTENKDKVLSFEHKYELDRLIQNDPITINPEDGGPSHPGIHREVSQNSQLLTNFVSCLNEKATLNDHPSFDDNFLNKEILNDKRSVVVQDISNRTCDAFGKSLPSSKPSIKIDNSQVLSLHSAVLGSKGNCKYLKSILEELKLRYPEDFNTRLCSRNSKGFPPLQNAIESNNLQAALVLLEYSAQLPYFANDNKTLIRSPQSKFPLRIFYTTLKSAKHFPNVFWTGFCIQLSSDVSLNWIATNLPELSKTEYFDKNSPIEEALKLSEELLKAILQCNSTDPFESAVKSGLITKDLRFQDGSTLLKYIGQYSTLEIMHHFINQNNYVSFECTNGEYSLIEYAVSNLNVSVLRFLLEKLPSIVDQSLSPLQQNDSREEVVLYKIALCLKNALKFSLNNDNVQALELLLDFNARYDHTYDKQQDTLLHLMVIQCKPCTFVDCLMTKTRKSEKLIQDRGTGLFIDAQNAQKETALHLALQTKQESVIKTILDFDPEIVSKDSNGNTPLHLSVLLNNYEIIEDVLKHSKQNLKLVNSVNKQNCTPLHLSVDNGDYKVTELLLRSNADIYCQDLDKRTVLHHALKIADSERRYLMVDKLIKFEEITFSTNTLCTMRDNNGNTPFSLAYAMSDHEIVTRLLEIPSVLKTTNESQQTPLHLAIIHRDERSLKSILNAIKKTEKLSDENSPKRDSSINSQDSSGCTPLHLSIQRKNTDALSKLLAVNPYLDIFNNDGDQPLHLAILSEENGIIDYVLDSILKLEVECIGSLEQRLICTKQRDGKTPLHLSIENRNTHALQSLLQTKPCLDVCDTNGDTVLHCAVKNSSDDSTCLEIVLKDLEEHFSDNYSYYTYMLNSRKLTPLHYAIKSSNLNCVKMLLEHQVNLAFLDPCGDKTLLDGIDGFSLSFVKHNGEYWIGYKFTKARKPYWILTNLPNLNHTEIVERDLPTIKISDFKLLKLISQSQSTEPLDAALRNKLLNVNTSLNHEHMSQVIARHGTKQSLRCLLSKTKYGLFLRSDGKPSMIECAVSNPNIDALDYLLHSLPTFQQQQQQPGDIANEPLSEESTQICSCLKNSLQLSVSNDSSEALISLLRFYPKIDCTNIDDNALIHQMVINNKSSKFIKEVLEVIREIETSNSLLYKDKQIINHSNFEKKTALHCCIERKQLSTLEVILQFNPGAFVVDKNDETPLHYAVNSNELEFVRTIYQHAPCIELLSAKNNVADTALHLAVKNANDGIVRYLLECKPPFDSQNSHGSTVLHLAVVIENPTQRELIMNQLILHNANKGLNVTCIQDSELKSPLHLAVSKQYPDAVDSLLVADPRALHIRDIKKQTPLHLTIAPSCLTPKPSNPLVPVGDMESVFSNQIFDNVLDAIEQQGKHEKNCCNGKHLICMQDERKRTALHYAIEHDYSHAFTEILKTGACLDIPDEDGNSLLHEATKM